MCTLHLLQLGTGKESLLSWSAKAILKYSSVSTSFGGALSKLQSQTLKLETWQRLSNTVFTKRVFKKQTQLEKPQSQNWYYL